MYIHIVHGSVRSNIIIQNRRMCVESRRNFKFVRNLIQVEFHPLIHSIFSSVPSQPRHFHLPPLHPTYHQGPIYFTAEKVIRIRRIARYENFRFNPIQHYLETSEIP